MIDKKLMEILACPACHGDVSEESEGILCHACKRLYPVVDDIPVMLIEEAKMQGEAKRGKNE